MTDWDDDSDDDLFGALVPYLIGVALILGGGALGMAAAILRLKGWI